MRAYADFHGYQKRTVTALYESSAVQAVLPMGAGKTAAALTAIDELLKDGEIRHALVLAPKRVVRLVWRHEHKQWEHLSHLDDAVSLATGTSEERAIALGDNKPIHVMGVDNIKWLVDILVDLPHDHPFFDLLVIDELSRFKNPRSKWARALKKVIGRFKNRWGLTGTPRPNGYQDQWGPLKLISGGTIWPDEFFGGRGGYDGWLDRYFMAIDFNGYRQTIRPEWRDKIRADINAYSFTIDPKEMPELPELVPVYHWVDLPPDAMRVYKQMEKDLIAKIVRKAKDGRTIIAVNAGVQSGKCCQIAQGFIYGEGGHGDAEFLHAAKADMLVDLIDDLAGAPALVCYGFREDLDAIHELYPKMPYLGAGVSDAKADEYEAAWNKQELPLLGLHPASAGHGLNLQHGGNQMIWYCLPWSAEQFDQTRKRYWRQGQTMRCFEHFIMARNTVDEVKYDRVFGKMSEQDAFIKYLRKV